MKTLFTMLLMAVFATAFSQKFIKNDFSLGISTESDMDIMKDDQHHVLLNNKFHFISLNKNYMPGETDTIVLAYDGIYRTVMGVTCRGNSQFLLYWLEYDGIYNYIKMADLNADFSTKGDPEVIDSSSTGYASALGFISKRPDAEKQIGLTWSVTDTLYAAFYNTETRTLSKKMAILKGTGVAGIQAVDFMTNGNIRLLWRDVNGNVRHKVISKTGESVVNETVIINKAEYFDSYGGNIDYSSNAGGSFLVGEFHTNPNTYYFGIETRIFNSQGVLTGGPAWVCDSINVGAWDDVKTYFDCTLQDDGKAAVAWRNMWYNQELNNYLILLYMQFIDESGNLHGPAFRPVKVNDESLSKSFQVMEMFPSVTMQNDTAMLLWCNLNAELSANAYLYMNIQKYTLPEVSAIGAVNMEGFRHSFISYGSKGAGALLVESPVSANATLELFSITGSALQAAEKLDIMQGENLIPLTPNTGSGVYFYRLTVNGVTVSGKAF